jgi:hypothetical protein
MRTNCACQSGKYVQRPLFYLLNATKDTSVKFVVLILVTKAFNKAHGLLRNAFFKEFAKEELHFIHTHFLVRWLSKNHLFEVLGSEELSKSLVHKFKRSRIVDNCRQAGKG